jgi:lipoprotein-anchoring transpeptidase ErfK/SrfK
MSRSRPRTSRVLLILLGLTVAVGAVTFANQYRRNRANAAPVANASAPATPAAPAPVAVPADEAIVTTTPTGKPAVVIAAATPVSAVSSTATPTPSTVKTPAANPAPAARSAANASLHAAAGVPASLPNVIAANKTLAAAKALADADELLEARDAYNAALVSGKLKPDEVRATKFEISKLNETVVFNPRRFDADAFGGSFTVPSGGVLAKIAKRFDITPELLLRINGMADARRLQAGKSIKVVKGPLHAVVDKSDFTLDVYFGAPGGPNSTYLTTFRVGLGKDNSTPLGKWVIKPGGKVKNPVYYSPRGEGVIAADDPKNPLGEYWLALQGTEGDAVNKQSYGIHGTIDPGSIGTMASMGCIRLKNEDIERVYELLIDGKSTVVVTE